MANSRLSFKTKEGVQFIMSLIVLIAGVGLLFTGLFLQPVGIIHYTVITSVGMLLSFVGAVWNIDIKYSYKTKELESKFSNNEKDGE